MPSIEGSPCKVVIALWLVSAMQFAGAQDLRGFQGNAMLGRMKADDERCVECHGAYGQGNGHAEGAQGKFPKLAGQNPQYMLNQIQNFRTGQRKSDLMEVVARNVTDEDVRDILAYFSSLPCMNGNDISDRQ